MSEKPIIVPIVEGDGERHAVPGLVRKILWACDRYDICVAQGIVAKGKPKLLKNFENLLRLAINKGASAILVLLDADDRCPREEATCLAKQAHALNLQVPIAVVCAKNEYETWFICSLAKDKGTKIKEHFGLPEESAVPDNPEEIKDAKGWLRKQVSRRGTYRETADQEKLTHHIELKLVQERSRSFCRFWHAIEELVQAVESDLSVVTPQMK